MTEASGGVVAIIPARAGSRRVPGKNVRALGGKPLIVHSIEQALDADGISRCVVSTDDETIAKLALDAGAEAPFLRPSELATDTATDKPVAVHAVRELETRGASIDFVLWLRPTCPFRSGEDIQRALTLLSSGAFDSVRSVSRVEEHPYWMKRLGDDNALTPLIEDHTEIEFPRSQLLPSIYRINGVVDGLTRAFLEAKDERLFGGKMGGFETPTERSLDIDTPEDFELAERRWQDR